MDRKPTFTRVALISLLVLLVAPMEYLGQQAWMYMSSAVSPYSTGTLETDQGNVLVSVGGERWASWFAKEQATAYHALVVPPQGAFREADGSSSSGGGDDFTDKVTLKWPRMRDRGNDPQAAEAGSFTIVYHALTHRVSLGRETYWLAKGNLFLVRLDDEWRPHVTQVGEVVDKPIEIYELVEAFKRALPDDEEVERLH